MPFPVSGIIRFADFAGMVKESGELRMPSVKDVRLKFDLLSPTTESPFRRSRRSRHTHFDILMSSNYSKSMPSTPDGAPAAELLSFQQVQNKGLLFYGPGRILDYPSRLNDIMTGQPENKTPTYPDQTLECTSWP